MRPRTPLSEEPATPQPLPNEGLVPRFTLGPCNSYKGYPKPWAREDTARMAQQHPKTLVCCSLTTEFWVAEGRASYGIPSLLGWGPPCTYTALDVQVDGMHTLNCDDVRPQHPPPRGDQATHTVASWAKTTQARILHHVPRLRHSPPNFVAYDFDKQCNKGRGCKSNAHVFVILQPTSSHMILTRTV